MVYLSSSKFSLAVLGNLGFALALATYKLLLRVRRRRRAAVRQRPPACRIPCCTMRCRLGGALYYLQRSSAGVGSGR